MRAIATREKLSSIRIRVPLALALFGACAAPAGATTTSVNPATAEFQARILSHYEAGRCDLVHRMVPPEARAQLRPNILAVAAYCEPPGADAEKMFARAEAADPTGDLIALLHAKSRWKKDPVSAEPLFRKVLMLARNPFMVRMAQEYLSGRIEQDSAISLSPVTYYGDVAVGADYEANPRHPEFVYSTARPSPGARADALMNAQRWVPWGSLGASYRFGERTHFAAHEFDLLEHELEARAAARVGPREDLSARLLGSYSSLGGHVLGTTYGGSVSGAIYRPDYKQSVQGMLYIEHLAPSFLAPQEGKHFRFEYAWEFFPPDWLVKFLGSFEHVEASHDTITTGITYSHNDVGVEFSVQHDFKLFMLAFSPKTVLRTDADVSSFQSPQGQAVTKRRNDYLVSLTPTLIIPLLPYLQLNAWYEWYRVFSNIGPNDYVDRNFQNQTVGVALKAYLSSY
ncbi:MAG: TonB-dependent receptor [Deltaproteobacteria bacterium]|nr:TonB-dependent receptor [Deltaproteobacteria bacterium]